MKVEYLHRLLKNEVRPTDHDLIAEVRRFPSSAFVALVARASASLGLTQSRRLIKRQLPRSFPSQTFQQHLMAWDLAELARISLAFSNEWRGRDLQITESDLLDACLLCSNLYDRFGKEPAGDLADFLLRTSLYQMDFQASPKYQMARTLSLFRQEVPVELEVLTGDWERELLGCLLEDYVGGIFAVLAYAAAHGGQVSLNASDYSSVLTLSSDNPADVAARHLTATSAQFRDLNKKVNGHVAGALRRYTPNPLRDRPIIVDLRSGPVVPVMQALGLKAGPMGIYYTGVARWNNHFCRDLGELFQSYVGEQLRLLKDAEVFGEVVYGKYNARTVDWFVVLPGLILVVEVKSASPNATVRAGGPEGIAEVRSRLQKGVGQIGRSDALIRDGAPELAFIPPDRRRVGILVTLEDFYVADAVVVAETAIDIPVRTMSARDLEMLVSVDDVQQIIADELFGPDRQNASVSLALEGREWSENPILDKVFNELPLFGSLEDVGSKRGVRTPPRPD